MNMIGAGELMIVMIFAIPLVAIICGTLVAIIKIARRERGTESKRLDREQVRMIQEMFRGIEKLSDRVDALETILLERERKEAQ